MRSYSPILLSILSLLLLPSCLTSYTALPHSPPPPFRHLLPHSSSTCSRPPSRLPAAGFGSPKASSSPVTRSLGKSRAGGGSRPMRDAANSYDRIAEDPSCERRDCYVRPPGEPYTFWFVGKVACLPPATPEMSALANKRLILEHAKALRPQDMRSKAAALDLQIFLAPPDSEMDVVRNAAPLDRVEGSAKDVPAGLDLAAVGFDPEIYLGDELTEGGLRVKRNEDGTPSRGEFEVAARPPGEKEAAAFKDKEA